MSLITIIYITKIDLQEQKRLLHLFARLDEDSKFNIFYEQKVFFHKLKSKYKNIDNKKLSYASFILAIKEYENAIDQDKLKAIKFKNQYSKVDINEKLNVVLSVILNLRDNEKYTYRNIAKYLKKYHKIDVVHSTIYNFYIKNKGKENVKWSNWRTRKRKSRNC